MNDTSVKMTEFYQDLIMKRSGEDRLKMGCSMFETAKEIVKSSILEQNPGMSLSDLKKAVFVRFYGHEMDKNYLQEICKSFT